MPATVERKDLFSIFPPGRMEFIPEKSMDEDEFFELCQRVDPLQLERDPNGTIIVMPPAGSYSSNRSVQIASQLQRWSEETNRGIVFDSSGGFTLPNGAIRAPDAAWVASHRLKPLSRDEKEKFLPLAPDFAAEVRSQNDARSDLEVKMEEYVDNGTRLGWLIDPYEETVTVFRKDGSTEEFDKPATLLGEPVLPGFECNLERIWEPTY
ncbi:MAG: Uma2 family endonuclease [Salinibacter sp.]